MSNVVCPGCSANYPEENVAKVARFRCAGCGEILAGGLAAPGAAARAPAPAAPAHAAPRHAHRRAPAERAARGGVPPAVWVVGGVVLVGAIAAVVATSGGHGAAAPDSPSAASGAPSPDAPPKADPMKDAAAWKALPSAEREARAAGFVAAADVTSADAAVRARDFLTARGETAAVASLAERALAGDGDAAWAHAALGHVNVGSEVDTCLAQNPEADDANDESYIALKQMRERHRTGTWWADADAAKKVRDLIAEVKKSNEVLKTPYGQAVAHWISLQRATPIMRDNPALHAIVGPYVIFVSLNVPRDPKNPTKDVTMADVPKEEIARGTIVLDRDKQLFGEYYDAWMAAIGTRLGLTRYGPENADLKTLMKVNVFSKPEDFAAYNAKTGAGIRLFTRAYYSAMEPRYVTTYDASGVKAAPEEETEDIDYVDHVQCHEATHQLVHFYTWDLTRKDIGREPDWLHVHWRPLWSGEGFAEFCSAFTMKDGKRVWMQPLDNRMAEMACFYEMMKEKDWKDWSLKDFLNLSGGLELERFARVRAHKNEDEMAATGVLSNLFYGEAWSFIYFLWYAEENGKPKYRDRYIDYLKAEFHVKFIQNSKTGEVHPSPAYTATFAQVMGLDTDAQWQAFEKEWKAYIQKLLVDNRKPSWDTLRTKYRKNFGFDKPPAKKDDKPTK